MARMLLEMANIDFDNLTPEQEDLLLQDYEELSNILLDSMGFKAGPSGDGVTFTATFCLEEPETFIRRILAEEASANP